MNLEALNNKITSLTKIIFFWFVSEVPSLECKKVKNNDNKATKKKENAPSETFKNNR